MSSIRARLLALLLPTLLLVILVVAVTGYLAASRRISAFLDADLAESARVLLLWTLAEPRSGDEVNPANIRRELDELFRGEAQGTAPAGRGADWQADLRLDYVLARPGVIARVTSDPALAAPRMCATQGYAWAQGAQGRSWRVFTVSGGAVPPATVCVGQRAEQRRSVMLAMLLPSVRWWLLVLPLAGLVVVAGVRRGLAPLDDITRELRHRRPGELATLAAVPPREVGPLIDALNGLLARQRALIEQERRFSAEAAHELRTPLATMRLRAERALAPAGGPGRGDAAHGDAGRHGAADGAGAPGDAALADPGAGRVARDALASIIEESERAERVLGQLLALARIDAAGAEGLELVATPLAPLLREVLAGQADEALARGVELELHLDEGRGSAPAALVEPVSLRLLLRNLVDNAVRYSSPGARVRIAVAALAQGVRVAVCDEGPGISPALRRRICEPFQRGDRHDEAGTGLGLTIARRVAELHGTRLVMADGPGGRGLDVSVLLPAPGR